MYVHIFYSDKKLHSDIKENTSFLRLFPFTLSHSGTAMPLVEHESYNTLSQNEICHCLQYTEPEKLAQLAFSSNAPRAQYYGPLCCGIVCCRDIHMYECTITVGSSS